MTAAELLATAQAWLALGKPAIDVMVLRHRGSVPRETGTHMLVAADAVAGTIGGGHLELQAIAQARIFLSAASTSDGGDVAPLLDHPIALGPSLGQCCGGSLVLRYRWLNATALQDWVRPAPRFHLQLHGAGHVGRAIVHLLAGLPCEVTWVDEREAEFSASDQLPRHIQVVATDEPVAEVAHATPGSFFLVLTHSHDLDLRITEAILRRGDFSFCGLIGSATKRARFMHRYEQRGVTEEALARLTCPIGLPGIAGKEPEVIAVSVVAQLLEVAGPPGSRPTTDLLAPSLPDAQAPKASSGLASTA
ncbi:MAG: hypothetical protein RL722_2376 [Pseudomonadota bacterium]|jgi:xanthine dehydrogenase accessory factor